MLTDAVLAVLIVPVLVLAWRARSKGRHWAGVWLLTIAPLFMPMAEDGFLAFWLAVATPDIDPHGARGVIPGHTVGHMLGAGVAAIALGIAQSYVARVHLRGGAPWAWRFLLWTGIPVVAVGIVEVVVFYGHGLTTLAADAEGFGWPIWVAGVLAWTMGLVLARPPHLHASNPHPETT